jgi:hypothetical protein
VHRGPITKQGSGLTRWATIEAAQKIHASAGWLIVDPSDLPAGGVVGPRPRTAFVSPEAGQRPINSPPGSFDSPLLHG